MTRAEQWDKDTKVEAFAAEFLDKHFYPKIAGKMPVTRYADTYHQFGGVDVSISTLNFDEKCKCYGCLNKVLPYPSMECSLINKAGNVHDGWLVADGLSTDYYALIGISASVWDVNDLTASSQISAADVLWVKKQDILDLVLDYTTIEALKEDVAEERELGDKIEAGLYDDLPDILGYGKTKDGKYRRKYPHRKFWLTYSSRLKEKPVNLVMPRATYESLPHTRHFIVTREKVRKA